MSGSPAGNSEPIFSERCKHTSAIVFLNGLVVFESVFMMALATNPFFGTMDKPTPAFIAFMILQIALLGAAVIFTVGTCACKERLVRANRVLFVVVGVVNAVYGIAMLCSKNLNGGITFILGALIAILGAMLCRRFLVLLTHSHQQLPTTSPSFGHHKMRV